MIDSFPAKPPALSPDDIEAIKRQILEATTGMDPQDVIRALMDAASPRGRVSKKPLPLLTKPTKPTQFRIRIDLIGAKPPIWRRLTLPSQLTLDHVHELLQSAFGWTNSHLHRFALASDPYARETQGILTPFDVEEGDEGVLESELRLDQLLAQKGDRLFYTYDFGDDWQHRLTLEVVEPLEHAVGTGPRETTGVVRCIDGRRQGPMEDVGGIEAWDQLVAVIANPSSPEYRTNAAQIFETGLWGFRDEIDLDGINRGLERTMGGRRALEWLRNRPADQHFVLSELLDRLGEEQQRFLAGYLVSAGLAESIEVDEAEAEKATRVIRTFLWGVGEGIRLTDAGYLPPKAVMALMAELDPEKRTYGQANREVNIPLLLSLREAVMGLGLVRKYRGVLSLTKRGAQLADAPVALWRYLAERLPAGRTPHGRDIGLLLLLLVAAGEAGSLRELSASLDMLSAMLGWRFEGKGQHGNAEAIFATEGTRSVLGWAGSGSFLDDKGDRSSLDAAGARLLARAALVPRR